MRTYREALTNIFSRDSENGFINAVPCAREACQGPAIESGERSWRVSHNRSDGWVTRLAHVHPACGEVMEYRSVTGAYRPAHTIIAVDERV